MDSWVRKSPQRRDRLPTLVDIAGKESACSVGGLGLIPGLGRSLEEGMAAHSNILAWRIPMDREAWWPTGNGVAKSWT